ncbi:MAG: hypothetical protein HN490_01675 [Gammaproteobacteria bacterium]|nr:hypothetical protein [Gammaproteobacteria bacterium]
MSYQIKIDMDNKSLLDLVTRIVTRNIGVDLGQVYDDTKYIKDNKLIQSNGYKLATSQAEILEEIGFKTSIITTN